MPINQEFIPGQWIDTIDVNDFVNLNKKPFLQEPLFLDKSSNSATTERFLKVKDTLLNRKEEVVLSFPSLQEEMIPYFSYNFFENPLKMKIGHSENFNDYKNFYGISSKSSRQESRKTTYQHFEEVVTSEINKMIKMNLFQNAPTTYSPSYIHPDIRIVALYGTKQLIKEKRWGLKTLEKHLQTHEWMQRRISIHREIEAIKKFDKFAQNQGIDVSNPAQTAEEAIQYTVIALGGCMVENPSIPFSLSQVIPFLDIYIEHDLQNKTITEEKAQELMDDFYLKLSFIRFSLSPGLALQHEQTPYYLGETFGGENVTKTTYRFLYAVKKFNLFPFSIRISWNEHLPFAFQSFIQELISDGHPVSFYSQGTSVKNESLSFYANGLFGVPSEDVLFDAGACDLEKLFYLSLNGGKDLENNINLTPITQPIRSKELNFEEVLGKFKDYLSYTLSSYVEMMNIVIYLNEVHNNHPLRSSLMSHLLYYQVQFGFLQLEKTVSLMTAIYTEEYEVIRDNKGWVTEIIPANPNQDSDIILSQLSELIQREIEKIPLYKNGKANVKFYFSDLNAVLTESQMTEKLVIPAELDNSIFHASFHANEDTDVFLLVKDSFDKGYRELHISTKNNTKLVNGILYCQK